MRLGGSATFSWARSCLYSGTYQAILRPQRFLKGVVEDFTDSDL